MDLRSWSRSASNGATKNPPNSWYLRTDWNWAQLFHTDRNQHTCLRTACCAPSRDHRQRTTWGAPKTQHTFKHRHQDSLRKVSYKTIPHSLSNKISSLEINAKRPNTGSDQKAKEHHEDVANQKAAKCNLRMGTCTNTHQTMQNGMSIAVLRLCSQFKTMNAGEGTRRNAGSDFSKSPIHFPNVSSRQRLPFQPLQGKYVCVSTVGRRCGLLSPSMDLSTTSSVWVLALYFTMFAQVSERWDSCTHLELGAFGGSDSLCCKPEARMRHDTARWVVLFCSLWPFGHPISCLLISLQYTYRYTCTHCIWKTLKN